MHLYSLATAWNWEYDSDLMAGIERECAMRGISLLQIVPETLPDVLEKLQQGEIGFRVFFDRASDADDDFLPLVERLEERAVVIINPHRNMERARDKATMHLEFITHGLQVPFTVIIPPYSQHPEIALSVPSLERLGTSFIIKPANTTGGGTGVVMGARTLDEVMETRQHHKDDKYLLQETVVPTMLDGRRAWFRVLYAFGEILPCWWDDRTHVYETLLPQEEERYALTGLRPIMNDIRAICRLDFFSSEIALTDGAKFVVVDYVNEICDMRVQSKYYDGVPDAIVDRIERLLVNHVETTITQTGS